MLDLSKRGDRVVMIRLLLIGLLILKSSLIASDLSACDISNNCNDGEVCVSYTSCDERKNRQQVRKCLTRSCYSKGHNCPGSTYCQNKHCGDLRCN